VPIEDERQVVLDWKNGSEKAFEALVRNYMGEAFYVAYGFVGNVEDARDLSQDAFIKAYRARDRFVMERLKENLAEYTKLRSEAVARLASQEADLKTVWKGGEAYP